MTRLLLLFVLLFPAPLAFAENPPAAPAPASDQIDLYFFWSERCPHCQAALPVVNEMAARLPWLKLHSLEVSRHPENARQYVAMAKELGERARSVPAFIFCKQMSVGFDSAEGTGRTLEERLNACHDSPSHSLVTSADDSPVTLSLFGNDDLRSYSLPLVTLIIAGLDAFNPCAFFVLLFLLSLLAHEPTRTRMLIIGGVFVLFSGLIYFALMAAWLNLFMATGELRAVTIAAGLIALFMAVVNIKDFLWFKRGISFSIPESAKPKLFQRVRNLLHERSWPLMLLGTVTLAVAANSYEALCTAGFPMVYTRLLTLQGLSTGAYYGYLALYNLIYVLPLLAIVIAFAFTMGSRKLGEAEGRVLKLVSGVMMLGLGGALLFAPQMLNEAGAAFLFLAAAIFAGALGYFAQRRAPS